MSFKTTAFALLGVFCLAPVALAQNIIEDNGVGMSLQELEIFVKYWTPDMQQAAANDPGDRLELLNMALANKKIAEQAKQFTPAMDPDRYWKNQFIVRNIERKFVVDNFIADLEIPDMEALAKETYLTAKDKYASVPERRKSSHILIRCTAAEQCNVEEKRALAEKVLAELQAGAAFEALAAQYSEDPGSKDKGGVFDRWLEDGMEGVDPHYLQGVFQVGGVGQHSGLVESQFGFHIIRLDEVEEKHYRPYEEARADIIAQLEYEYKTLAAKEFDAQYRLSDKAYIDKEAMDKLFAPYLTEKAPAK